MPDMTHSEVVECLYALEEIAAGDMTPSAMIERAKKATAGLLSLDEMDGSEFICYCDCGHPDYDHLVRHPPGGKARLGPCGHVDPACTCQYFKEEQITAPECPDCRRGGDGVRCIPHGLNRRRAGMEA
jgi:hypothetical protein